MNPRKAAGFFVLGSLILDCKSKRPADVVEPAPTASESPRSEKELVARERTANGHRYLEIERGGWRLELRLTRPQPEDREIALAVAGTYTSPEGTVEGVVVHDGRVVSRAVKPWQGLLLIHDGKVELRRSEVAPDPDTLAKEGASVLQGHLLVFEKRAEKLKPSPELRRRAIATRANGEPAVVESRLPETLLTFADDLVALGFERAMNLDMGAWSEGFYRDRGGLHALGDDTSATDKQTNWLVLTR